MFKKILIPIDLSVEGDGQKLLQRAVPATSAWDAELHVATVIPNMGMPIVGTYFDEGFEKRSRDAATEQLSKVLADAGVKAKEHVLAGRIYECIINLAAELDADLILLGAHQPGLRDYLLGSNAARVVRHSNASVLVIRD